MTKRLFILALCLALIAACYGCRGTASTAAAPDAPKASVQAKDATWQQHTDTGNADHDQRDHTNKRAP